MNWIFKWNYFLLLTLIYIFVLTVHQNNSLKVGFVLGKYALS